MGVWPFLAVTLASFIAIGAKAFQQLNVVHDYRRLIPLVSAVMAICEVGIAGNIAVHAVGADFWALGFTVVAMVIGASSGALTSMALHKRMRKNGRAGRPAKPVPHHWSPGYIEKRITALEDKP